MTDTEQSKAVVGRFLEAFSRGDYDTAFTFVDKDVCWGIWSGGLEPDVLTWAQIKGQLEQVRSAFAEPIAWSPTGITAEGGHVAVEIEGRGVTNGGHRYRNRYHNLFVVRDGLIVTVREMFEDAPVAGLMAAITAEAQSA